MQLHFLAEIINVELESFPSLEQDDSQRQVYLAPE